MTELDLPGRKLLTLLVDRLHSHNPVITYGEALSILELPNDRVTAGQSLEAHGLGSLANWLFDSGYPGITGIVVDGETMQPGNGFFRLFQKDKNDVAWWLSEIDDAKSFNWAPFILLTWERMPRAIDVEKPPGRVKSTTYRIIRDTAAAARVKKVHDHRCQLCGHTVTLANGQKYSEAHHVRPLGHDGLDHAGNLMCVCPNHHAQLDYAAVPLSLDDIAGIPGHQLEQSNIDYHNDMHERALKGLSIAYAKA